MEYSKLTASLMLHIMYGVLDGFCFYQIKMLNFNIKSLHYNKVIRNFTIISTISCVVECFESDWTCTHVVTKGSDDRQVQCTCLHSANGTSERVIGLEGRNEGRTLWTKGLSLSMLAVYLLEIKTHNRWV